MSVKVMACGWAPLPEEVSNHPEASTWLPVLIAGIDDHGWYVRCPDCGRPNHHGSEPGFRVSHCHCEGMLQRRQMNGYVIAPPGATHAPYPDFCRMCRDSGDRLLSAIIYTAVDLTAGENGRGVVARYACDRSHYWDTRWRDYPYGPPDDDEPSISLQGRSSAPVKRGGGSRCALYRHYDEHRVLLYVGISDRPVTRGKTHAASSEWVEYARTIEAEWLSDRAAAEVAERQAIRNERPIFNRIHALGDVEARIRSYKASRGG